MYSLFEFFFIINYYKFQKLNNKEKLQYYYYNIVILLLQNLFFETKLDQNDWIYTLTYILEIFNSLIEFFFSII